MQDEKNILETSFRNSLADVFENKTFVSGSKVFAKNKKILKKDILDISLSELRNVKVKEDKTMKNIESLCEAFDESLKILDDNFKDKVDKVQSGDDLLPGVMKLIKVFVAVKRQLAPGDKMSGRHGNKGVISKIIPVEDMETHLGAAAVSLGQKFNKYAEDLEDGKIKVQDLKNLFLDVYGKKVCDEKFDKLEKNDLIFHAKNLKEGVPFATPVFDGAKEKDLNKFFEIADSSTSGEKRLIDGRTGQFFDRPITVGQI